MNWESEKREAAYNWKELWRYLGLDSLLEQPLMCSHQMKPKPLSAVKTLGYIGNHGLVSTVRDLLTGETAPSGDVHRINTSSHQESQTQTEGRGAKLFSAPQPR